MTTASTISGFTVIKFKFFMPGDHQDCFIAVQGSFFIDIDGTFRFPINKGKVEFPILFFCRGNPAGSP